MFSPARPSPLIVAPARPSPLIVDDCYEQGSGEKIQLVPINLQDRPAWYKEKVYPANEVPPLEHYNEVKGESLDLIGYIDSHFEGPSPFPDDPGRKEFGEELLSYTDSFNRSVFSSVKQDEIESADWTFDYIEAARSKFEDGPFFLGKFSLVDIAYAPFLERFQLSLMDLKKYDIAAGRPKLAAWIEALGVLNGTVWKREGDTGILGRKN